MINIKKLLNSKRVEVKYLNPSVDGEFVKNFREKNELTQVALANIMGVTKKAIEKWEQGANKVKGSAAILIQLLDKEPALIDKLREVNVIDESGERFEMTSSINKTYHSIVNLSFSSMRINATKMEEYQNEQIC